MKIACKGKLEEAVWAATYAAEFVRKSRKIDQRLRANNGVAAANAAVGQLRLVTRRAGEMGG